MADVKIPPNHWTVLKNSANCFVPKLVVEAVQFDINNKQLFDASRIAHVGGLSAQLIGKMKTLESARYNKCEDLIKAHNHLRTQKPDLSELGAGDIVGAFFLIPQLGDLMDTAAVDRGGLGKLSGVSRSAIVHARTTYEEGGPPGRVTWAIVCALHKALGTLTKVPELDEFATSHPDGERAVNGTPFTIEDLLLPILVPLASSTAA